MKSGPLPINLKYFNWVYFRLLILVILTVNSVISYADTHTWVPTAGGAWTTATNWSPAGLPVAGDDVIINNDQTANITAVPNLNLNSLTVNGTCNLIGSGGGTTLTIGGAAGTDFTILTGKTMTIGANLNISLAANAASTINGTLVISTGRVFNINGNGIVTTVSGTIQAFGSVTSTNPARLIFQTGSTYNHATNGGTVPTATWADGSTCLITGVVATPPAAASLGQSFYNLRWNNPGQTYDPTTGSLTAGADYKIRGTFTFENSGTGSNVWPSLNCTVANYVHTGGIDRLSYTNPRTHTIGSISVTGGITDFTQSTGSPVINISGNVYVTGGTLTASGAGSSATINLVGPGIQTFTSGGVFSGALYWNIQSGSTVDFGTSVLSGSAASTFTLFAGGSIITANVNGLTTTGANGSVQVGGTRLYSPGANYEYNGPVAQVTGNGLTGATNLTIDNIEGVTLSGNVAVTGTLNFINGLVTTGANTLSMDQFAAISGADLGTYVNGNLQWNIGTGAQIKVFEIGDANRYAPLTVIFGSVTTAGTLTGSTRGVAHPNLATSPVSSTKYVRRYYTLTNGGVAFNNANVILNWGISDLQGFPDYTKFIIGLYNSGWTSPTFSGRTSTSIHATNLTFFGDLVVGETSCVAPVITGGPASQTVTYGTDATFTVTAAGSGVTYKWQEDKGSGFADLTDGGIYSGSATSALKLTNPAVSLSGYKYRCILTGNCGSPLPTATSPGAPLTVTAKDLIVTGLTALNKVYDANNTATLGGTAVITVIGTDVVNLGGIAAGTFSDKNVGTAKPITVTGLTISGANAANYNLIQQTGLTADISRADLTLGGLSALNKVYDANTSAVLSGLASITVLGSDVVIINGIATGSFADKNVGTGKAVTVAGLTLSGTDAGNYNLIRQLGLTADITKANLTVNGLKALNKVYDANTSASIAGLAVVNGLGGDVVTVGGTPTGTFNDKNVGTAKPVTVSGIIISGADADNYTLIQQTGLSADITKANLLVTGLIASNKVYDATATATLIGTVVISGALGTDVVTISGTITGSFADKNVGTGKTVSVAGSLLSGADAGNYTLFQPSLTADITPKALTITADNKIKIYITPNPALTMSFSGFVGGDNASSITIPAISTSAVFGSSVGSYPITLSGGSAANYTLTLVNGILIISRALQTITFTDIPTGLRMTQQYQLEASASSGLPIVFVSSDPTIVSISGNIINVLRDGTVTITASQSGDNNWNPAGSVIKTVVTLPTFDNINSLFTPNNDGVNDYWYIPNLEQYGKLQVTVYNRFGQAVFKSDSYNNDWDGTWNGYQLPSASYYYIMKSSVKGVIKGVVNIVR